MNENPNNANLVATTQNGRIITFKCDRTLWEAIHLRSEEGVPAKLLEVILENGCKYFSFPFVLGIKGTVKFNQNVQLKYFHDVRAELGV